MCLCLRVSKCNLSLPKGLYKGAEWVGFPLFLPQKGHLYPCNFHKHHYIEAGLQQLRTHNRFLNIKLLMEKGENG